ncbi:hypothetical protein pb186bvf_008133 [Paramecium bursaria]
MVYNKFYNDITIIIQSLFIVDYIHHHFNYQNNYMKQKVISSNLIRSITINLDRGQIKECQICNQPFTFMKKEHQCKRCKRAICDKCGPYKAIIQNFDKPSKNPHRLCVLCKDESDLMNKFVEQYKIQYNFDTYSIEWLKVYNTNPKECENTYNNAKKDSQQRSRNEYDLFKGKLDDVYKEIETHTNYSLKEFLVVITQAQQQNQIKQILDRVLGTFLIMFPEVGFHIDQILITHFLLCFSSEASAYILLTIIYGYIYPPYLYQSQIKLQKYEYENEINMIMGASKEGLQLSDIDSQIVKNFLEQRTSRYLSTFGLNFFLFETSFQIFCILFQQINSYNELLKIMSSVVTLNSQVIRGNSINYDESELYIMRSLKSSQLILSYNQLKTLQIQKYKLDHVKSINHSIDPKLIKQDSREQQDGLSTEIQRLQDKLLQYEEALEAKDKIIQDFAKQNRNSDVGRFQQTILNQNDEIERLNKQIQELSQQNNPDSNNKELENVMKQLEQSQNENEELQNINKDLNDQILAITSKNEIKMLQIDKSFQQMSSHLQYQQETTKDLANQITKLTDENDKKQQQIQQLVQELQQLRQNDKLVDQNLQLYQELDLLKKSNEENKSKYSQLLITNSNLTSQIELLQNQNSQNVKESFGDNELQKLKQQISQIFQLDNQEFDIIQKIEEFKQQTDQLQAQNDKQKHKLQALKLLENYSSTEREELQQKIIKQNVQINELQLIVGQNQEKCDTTFAQLEEQLKINVQIKEQYEQLEKQYLKLDENHIEFLQNAQISEVQLIQQRQLEEQINQYKFELSTLQDKYKQQQIEQNILVENNEQQQFNYQSIQQKLLDQEQVNQQIEQRHQQLTEEYNLQSQLKQQQYDDSISIMENLIKQQTQIISNLEEEKQSISQSNSKLQAQLQLLENKYQDVEENNNKNNQIIHDQNRQLNEDSMIIDQLKVKLSIYEDQNTDNDNKLQQQIINLESQNHQLIKTQSENSELIIILQKQNQELTDKNNQLETINQQHKAQVDEFKNLIRDFEANIEELNQKNSQLKQDIQLYQDQYNSSLQKYETQQIQILELESYKEVAKESIRSLQIELEETIREKMKVLEELLSEKQDLQVSVVKEQNESRIIRESFIQVEEQIGLLQDKLDLKERECQQLNEQIQKLQNQIEIDLIEKRNFKILIEDQNRTSIEQDDYEKLNQIKDFLKEKGLSFDKFLQQLWLEEQKTLSPPSERDSIESFKYENQKLEQQLFNQKTKKNSIQSEIAQVQEQLQQLRQLILNVQILSNHQIFSFSENQKPLTKLRNDQDQEDAKMLLASRDTQITLLRSLVIEKQNQLADMNKNDYLKLSCVKL